jgi:hypothetical protein
MRFFTQADQDKLERLQYEKDMAVEAAQRFAEANLKLADDAHNLARANIELSNELVRLSQRATPVVPDGEVEQPKSVSDNDRVTLESPERAIRPEPPRPARVE